LTERQHLQGLALLLLPQRLSGDNEVGRLAQYSMSADNSYLVNVDRYLRTLR
jgi:hypothetical protein